MSRINRTMNEATTIALLNEQIKLNMLNLYHPLQRNGDQWSKEKRDNFIATCIRNEYFDSIKICEEMQDGRIVKFVIDGKQRITTIRSFINNGFVLGKKSIERPIISYFDANGKECEFDISGKRFSDLPSQLQVMINNCQVSIVTHMDCLPEDTAYHFRRYNNNKSLNVAQTAISYAENVAFFIKDLAKNHSFFKNCGGYTNTNVKNNDIERTIMESLVTTLHLDGWNKDVKKLAKYVNDNATEEDFNTIRGYFDRLDKICQAETNGVPVKLFENEFNKKDTMIWLPTFAKFTEYGLEDSEFARFLTAFENESIDMTLWEEANEKSNTKDKSPILNKINALEDMMNEFFLVKNENVAIEFLRDNVNAEIDDEDIEFYEELLEDYKENYIRYGSKLLEDGNHLSLLAMVAYSEEKEINLDDWLSNYSNSVNEYNSNQKQNFERMKLNFDNYCASHVS